MSDDDADQAPSAERPSWRLVEVPICSAAFLLRTSWIRRVDGGQPLFVDGAHVCTHAAHGFVLLTSGSTTMMCVDGACVLYLLL